MIGFIDLDLFYTRYLTQPNYELCATATYYKLQGTNVRLIVDTSIENLKRYQKIYVFRSHKYGLKPAQLIEDYYQLDNVEEYGEGFPTRPLHPDLEGLIYVTPVTDIYHPLVNYLEKVKQNRFKLKHKIWFSKYQIVKYFYEDENELLTRQIISDKINKILIYDDPLIFFTTEKGQEVIKNLISKNKIIQFATPLDVSKLPTDQIEFLMTEKKFASLRKSLYATEPNKNTKNFLHWISENKELTKGATLTVELQPNENYKYYLINGLRTMNSLPKKIGNKVRIRPKITHDLRNKHYLLRYFYSWERKRNGSFYEYVIWRCYHEELEHKNLKQIDSVTVDYLFRSYGMKAPIVVLEEIMFNNKEAEDLVMKGGKSYYGTERARVSYIGGTPETNGTINFRTRPDRIRPTTIGFTYRKNRRNH